MRVGRMDGSKDQVESERESKSREENSFGFAVAEVLFWVYLKEIVVVRSALYM